jgi:hypothetical protein
LLAAALTAAPASAGNSGPRHVGIGIRLLDAPSNLIDDPRAHSYIIDSLRPGAVITRHVEVSNDTGKPAHLLIYADAAQIADGQFTAANGQTANELTSWMTVTPSSVDLPQGGTQRVTVVVRVPRNASAGERYGMVLADLPPTSTGPGIHVESRVGVRLYLNVGDGAPRVDFSINTLTAERDGSGRPVVQAQVHNIGARALDMRGTLKLTDGPGGLTAGPFAAKLGTTLAPGQSEPVTVVLDKALPAGPWHARIVLRSGLLARAAEGTITFPSGAGQSAKPVKATAVPLTKNRHVLVPIAIGLILALLLGLLLFLLWKRRKRKDDDEDETPGGGPAPSVPGQRRAADDVVRRP